MLEEEASRFFCFSYGAGNGESDVSAAYTTALHLGF
jgi:hypothetical protein